MACSWEEAHEGRTVLLRGWQSFRCSEQDRHVMSRDGLDVAYDQGPTGFGVVVGSGRVAWRLGEVEDLDVAIAACHRFFDLTNDTLGGSRSERFEGALAQARSLMRFPRCVRRVRETVGQIDGTYGGYSIDMDQVSYSLRDRSVPEDDEPLCTSSCIEALVHGLDTLMSPCNANQYERELRRLRRTVSEFGDEADRALVRGLW